MALYGASLDMLLERRDVDRGVLHAIRLDKSAKLAILQHLAWRLTFAGRVELSFEDCVHHVARAIARLPEVTVDAEVALRFLLERSGVIRDPVVNRIDFIHRTFQEYLAAKEAAEDHLIREATSDRWRETIIMAVGHATAHNRNEILTGILDRADREPKSARRLRLLASACLDTSQTVEPDVMARIDAALDKVLPPRVSRESRTLSLAGDRVLRRLPTSLDEISEAVGAACVRTAALVNGSAALRLLAGYASDPREQVQRELAKVWRYFDAEEYAKTVLVDAPLRNGLILAERREHVSLVRHLTKLTRLHVYVVNESELDWLEGVPYLECLNAVTSGTHGDLSPLREHQGLKILLLQGQVGADLDVFGDLPNVEDFMLGLADNIQSIDFLEMMPNLTSLRLLKMVSIDDLGPIRMLARLRRLGISRCMADPESIVLQCSSIVDLTLYGSLRLGLSGIEPILSRLDSLDVNRGPIGDSTPLARLTQAYRVGLGYTDVIDLRPMMNLPKLRDIVLCGCPPQLDLTPLALLPQRVTIHLRRGQEVRGLDAVRGRHRIIRL